MKISQWPSNCVEFVKTFTFPFIIILMIGGFITLMVVVVNHSIKRDAAIRAEYPIGKHVAIKGLAIDGTISHVSDCGCDIEVMYVDKDGNIKKISVDHNLIQ